MDENSAKRVREIFNETLDLKDTRKSINTQLKDLRDEAANIAGVNKALITKAFSFLEKRYEDGVDELDDIVTLTEELGK